MKEKSVVMDLLALFEDETERGIPVKVSPWDLLNVLNQILQGRLVDKVRIQGSIRTEKWSSDTKYKVRDCFQLGRR